MVVQHILCSRMGKREVKPIVPKVETSPEKNGNADKEESTDDKNTASDDPVKEEDAAEEDAESTEKEVKDEPTTTEDGEKSEVESTKKEEAKKSEESQVAEPKPAETPIPVVDAKPQFIEAEEYFVKYRNFSYLHCEWRTEEEMYKGDKRIQAKLKRFKQKQQQNTNIFENVHNIIHFQICDMQSVRKYILENIYSFLEVYITSSTLIFFLS